MFHQSNLCLLGFQTFGGAPNFTKPGYGCAVNLQSFFRKKKRTQVVSRLTTHLGVSNICVCSIQLGELINLIKNVMFLTEVALLARNSSKTLG